jgi:hypothetical protein
MVSFKVRSANGTIIEPAEIGLPPELSGRGIESEKTEASGKKTRKAAFNPLQGRSRACEDNTWVADAGKEDYTKPAQNTQLVYGSVVSGPTDITITQERSQSWTSTLGASLGFEDVISLGMSFEESYSETVTNGQSKQFHVPAGQTGTVGFTAYLECSTGLSSSLDKTPIFSM